jgi:hypothetical protein
MAETQQSMQTGGDKPLDDLTYDLVTIIYEKSKGLEAYDKYAKDAQGNEGVSSLLDELRNQDTQAVSRLKTELQNLLGNQ